MTNTQSILTTNSLLPKQRWSWPNGKRRMDVHIQSYANRQNYKFKSLINWLQKRCIRKTFHFPRTLSPSGLNILIDAALTCFTPIPPQQRKPYITCPIRHGSYFVRTKQRQNEQGLLQEARETESKLRKQIRKDKRQYIQAQLEEMDEHGYRWSGIKRLKKKFVPLHTIFRDSKGHLVSEAMFLEKAAEYLATVEWKQPEPIDEPDPQPLSNTGQAIKASQFEAQELDEAISATKTNKAPGPDRVQVELVKYLDSSNRAILLQSYNEIYLLTTHILIPLTLRTLLPFLRKEIPLNLKIVDPLLCCRPFTHCWLLWSNGDLSWF